jgi:hypothetical protein
VAKLRTTELPTALARRLCGVDVDAVASHAILLCTVDADGQPRPSMLSYFEVAAPDPYHLSLAVYTDSRTCANLRERGRATLVVADAGLVCYISGLVEAFVPSMRAAPYNAKVSLRVAQVVFDEASPDLEPGVHVTAGITCSPRTADGLARSRAVLAELLERRDGECGDRG